MPPHARRLRKAPDVLKAPSSTLISATLVDDVSFWRAPDQPRAVLVWEQAHLPRRCTPGDADFGPPPWDRMFSLSPIPGVLDARELVVEAVGAGNGHSAIRVDAQMSWQPPRPTAEGVPSAARMVTITVLARGMSTNGIGILRRCRAGERRQVGTSLRMWRSIFRPEPARPSSAA